MDKGLFSPYIYIVVRYHTYEPIDSVRLVWSDNPCRNREDAKQEAMENQGQDTWKGCLPVDSLKGDSLDFHIEVWRGDRLIDYEPFLCHHYCFPEERKGMDIKCCFIPRVADNNYRYTSAFSQCIHPFSSVRKEMKEGRLFLIVQDYSCPDGWQLFMTGSTPELGEWNVDKALPLFKMGNYSYAAAVPRMLEDKWEYKFVLRKNASHEVIWEEGENHTGYGASNGNAGKICFEEQPPLLLPKRDDRVAGVVVPLFSLRSKESWGVGDFGDLRKMIDWASEMGMHVLQMLPVNDTTRTGSWEDSYPYRGISVYALHPMYVDLNSLGKLKNKNLQKQYEEERIRLEEKSQVDYEAVNKLKTDYLKVYFQEHESSITSAMRDEKEGAEGKNNKMTLGKFWTKYRYWLKPYCCFRVLAEENGTADFRTWKKFSLYDEEELSQAFKDSLRHRKFLFYVWVQYVLALQLGSAHEYAVKKGIVLKGDMPIGIGRNSATAWFTPQYFHFDGQAGAPPDFFSALGQNWGFPTYNWNNILADNGDWWKRRLQYMSNYFDAFRIDHVLGFFRIWQIPYGTSDGRLGHFMPDLPMTEDEIRRNGFWKPMDECVSSQNDDSWDVLFIRDKKDPALFHPAVSGQSTSQYRQLSESDRRAFDRIHDDYFNHRHNDFWAQEGMKRLPCVVNPTSMLVCAEDLGMIPECVHGILDYFCILSLEVQSMPKRPEGRFSWLPNNPLCSVDTATTHDMEPLRLWWRNNPEAAQCYYEQRMEGLGQAPKELSPDMAEYILRKHMQSPSLLCVVALQDWLAIDADMCNPDMEAELVNNPANPHHYWRYRMHLPIERLAGCDRFNRKVRDLVDKRRKAL